MPIFLMRPQIAQEYIKELCKSAQLPVAMIEPYLPQLIGAMYQQGGCIGALEGSQLEKLFNHSQAQQPQPATQQQYHSQYQPPTQQQPPQQQPVQRPAQAPVPANAPPPSPVPTHGRPATPGLTPHEPRQVPNEAPIMSTDGDADQGGLGGSVPAHQPPKPTVEM